MPMPIARLGYHYYPDDRHFTQSDLGTWLPILDSIGARWLTIKASASRAVPEDFLGALREARIEPIVHIPARVGQVELESLLPLLESYSRWGLRHVVIGDRPNLRLAWDDSAWTRSGLIERYLDLTLPILHAVRSAGLVPTLPPLEPGGDFWDTAFLEATLIALTRRNESSLLNDLTLGLYAWTYDRPLNWGVGGPERWPEARPYRTPDDSQDQKGLHIFEWYASIASRAGGRIPQMLVIAGGDTLGQDASAEHLQKHSERNVAIARMLEGEEFPGYVQAFSFYPLATGVHHSDFGSAWFPSTQSPLPVVDAFRKFIVAPRHKSVDDHKPLRHYALLPENMELDRLRDWEAIARFIRIERPTLGFSPLEARLATRVTLIGDEALITETIAQELRDAGCKVSRLEVQPEADEKTRIRDEFIAQFLVGANHATYTQNAQN